MFFCIHHIFVSLGLELSYRVGLSLCEILSFYCVFISHNLYRIQLAFPNLIWLKISTYCQFLLLSTVF